MRDAGVPWVEALTENFLQRGGRPRSVLERVRQDARVILHGVSMSIGGCDPLDRDYLAALKRLADDIDAAYVSDHLCFSTFGGHHGHDLWPLPYTEECLDHVCARIDEAQTLLGRPLVIENVSSYVQYRDSAMPEWTFLDALARRSGAGVLLDVNNIYVSARNHGFDPADYLDGLDARHVRYIHVAGHSDKGDYLLDDHGGAVCEAVWAVYRQAVARIRSVPGGGRVPSIVEWDSRVPALDEVLDQSAQAARHEAEVLAGLAPEADAADPQSATEAAGVQP